MSSSDIFDILNIRSKSQSPQNDDTGTANKSKLLSSNEKSSLNLSSSLSGNNVQPIKATTSKPQVTGMQRELYNLLGENQPPIMVQPANRFKDKMAGKPSPWTYAEFWSSDQTDIKKRVKLKHWVKGSKNLVGDVPQTSTFCKFNQHLTLPRFTKEEYQSFMELARKRRVQEKSDSLERTPIQNSQENLPIDGTTSEKNTDQRNHSELKDCKLDNKEETSTKSVDDNKLDTSSSIETVNDKENKVNKTNSPIESNQADNTDEKSNDKSTAKINEKAATEIITYGTKDHNQTSSNDDSSLDKGNTTGITNINVDENKNEWDYEEVNYLFWLCRKYDLRWFIIYDRYYYESAEHRTLEDLKDKFYEVCQNYFAARNSKDPLLESLKYDKERELERKQYLNRLLSRTAAEIAEEEALIMESKKFGMAAKKILNERESLLRLLDSPNSDQNSSQYMTSQGISQLYNTLLTDKNRKRKHDSSIPENPWMKQQQQFAQQKQRLQQLHEKKRSELSEPNTKTTAVSKSLSMETPDLLTNRTNSSGADTRVATSTPSTTSPRKTKKQKLELQNSIKRKNEVQFVEHILQNFTEEEKKSLGVIAHGEKLYPGVYLRGTKISTFKPALQNKVIGVLQELGLPARPAMPSYDVVQVQEKLLKQIVKLLDLKKQMDKLDAEKAVRE
ncbi:Swc4p PWA37_004089 [Arxiozyma heterogenica]|uniref:Swc4p n=1 Tax=Arxiozyma heterogenica TaxID=278026 RepID=UPI002EF19D76